MEGQWSLHDYFFATIILVSTGFALLKGLMREIISLVSLLAGLLLAAFYYHRVGRLLAGFARTETVANLLGFLIIFGGCLLLGALAAFLVNRLIKMASLEWMDRLLGGLYGFLRGWMVASIIVLALIAFPVREQPMERSVLAPYLLMGARAVVLIVPRELRERFRTEYQRILQFWYRNES